MRILKSVDSYRPDNQHPLFLGLGNFDGVHAAHEELIRRLVQLAKEAGGRSAVLTFFEHPQTVLHPGIKPQLLTSPDQKLFLLKGLGVDLCFLLPFTSHFSKTEPAEFVEEILVKKLKVRHVCLGFNARFGHNRRGDAKMMSELAARFGFEFDEMNPVKKAGDFVSSSRIRKLVEKGQLEEAFECLSRPFSIFAEVVRGEGRGAGLGTPTANLKPQNDILPPQGVYPVTVRVLKPLSKEPGDLEPGPWLQGVLNYGLRPTFGGSNKEAIAEVFIFDFKENLYGGLVEVVFHPLLRTERAFSGPEALKDQIAKDVEAVKHYFRQSKKIFTKTAS